MNEQSMKERVKAKLLQWAIKLRDALLGLALIIGVGWWLFSDPAWKEQGFSSEESYEQAMDGGFEGAESFQAAQKYSVTSKSEWDALNQKVIDGGFTSIEAMREAAALGYSSQAAWDAALEQQAKEAGFAGVAAMQRAKELGYATQAEWDSAKERKRIETVVRNGADTLAPLVACRDMNVALTNGEVRAIYRAVGQSGLDRISGAYSLLLIEIENVVKVANDLPKDAQEEFGEMWRAKYQSLTADFWDLDTTSKLTAYESQCSARVQMICTRNNMRSPPDYLLKEECKRAGIR